ncbi:MAG: hypothetical protein P8Y97_17285 [Candidatus Lokiarchaeota archaeon]
MFKADESNSINPLQMERLNTQLRELRKNQELILERDPSKRALSILSSIGFQCGVFFLYIFEEIF